MEQKLKYEKKIDEKKNQNINAKLPKLVITHFKGTPADRLRFWGQFSAEIDAADISKITKFTYLKEILEPHVRSSIDGLLFTAEGYERAKNMLKTKYGKESEIHIYEELDFRRLSDGQNYENLRKIKVDVEYLELVDDPKLTTGNAASEVCNYPDGRPRFKF